MYARAVRSTMCNDSDSLIPSSLLLFGEDPVKVGQELFLKVWAADWTPAYNTVELLGLRLELQPRSRSSFLPCYYSDPAEMAHIVINCPYSP
jgi:hypothetical protein